MSSELLLYFGSIPCMFSFAHLSERAKIIFEPMKVNMRDATTCFDILGIFFQTLHHLVLVAVYSQTIRAYHIIM